MKLRQKLAAVLAATMIVTAVPVVTMAASTAKLTTNATVHAEGTTVGRALQLKLDVKDAGAAQNFYISLENAEFAANTVVTLITSAGVITATPVNDRIAFTNVDLDVEEITIQFPANTLKVTGGVASFKIDGGVSVVTSTDVTFATTKEGSATVTAKKVTSLYDNGEIGQIIVTEPYAGVLAQGDGKFIVQLDDSDFRFDETASSIAGKITGYKGFSAARPTVRIINDQTFEVTVPTVSGTVEAGELVIGQLDVSVKRGVTPTIGDLTVSVYGENVDTTDLKVAEVVEYGTVVEMKDKKVVDVTAGQTKQVEFTVKETAPDVFRSTGEKIYVELTDGLFFANVTTDEVTTAVINEFKRNANLTLTPSKTGARAEIIDLTFDGKKVIGFEMIVEGADLALDVKDSVKVSTKVNVPLDTVDATEFSVVVESKSFDSASTVAVKGANAITVEYTPIVLKSGLQGQVGGTVVITENTKGIIGTDVITLTLPEKFNNSVIFAKKPVVETSSNLNVKKVELVDSGRTVKLTVDRKSKEAATITLKDFTVDTDRSLPEGKWDLTIGGEALVSDDNKTTVKAEGFFQLGTLNTEDLSGVTKVVSTLSAGATTMVVNDETVELPAATYIKNGKMMAPLKAVAKAFGIKDSDIVWNSTDKSVTVVSNGRTAYLQIGNKAASLNGVPYTLATPAEIANDSTFVPVGDLGRLLGLVVEWDNATKTATFSN